MVESLPRGWYVYLAAVKLIRQEAPERVILVHKLSSSPYAWEEARNSHAGLAELPRWPWGHKTNLEKKEWMLESVLVQPRNILLDAALNLNAIHWLHSQLRTKPRHSKGVLKGCTTDISENNIQFTLLRLNGRERGKLFLAPLFTY